eukprot:5371646-Heterocapsa_arctica.AAC.1
MGGDGKVVCVDETFICRKKHTANGWAGHERASHKAIIMPSSWSLRGSSRSWTRAPSEGGAMRRAACRAAPLAFRRLNLATSLARIRV